MATGQLYGIQYFLHTQQGFPRFSPVLDISVFYQVVQDDLMHDIQRS